MTYSNDSLSETESINNQQNQNPLTLHQLPHWLLGLIAMVRTPLMLSC